MRSTLGPRRNVVDISPMELFILMSICALSTPSSRCTK